MGGMTDDEIYRKYSGDLVRFATALVGPFDAPDVVVDACLRAFSTGEWRKVANHRAYLYRAVVNQARSHHRSTLRRRLREMRSAVPEEVHVTESDLDVLAAVERLSVQQRAAVILTYWDDLTQEEVAARLGISSGSVNRHLARARTRLREYLDA